MSREGGRESEGRRGSFRGREGGREAGGRESREAEVDGEEEGARGRG